jgi:hypothetical protein
MPTQIQKMEHSPTLNTVIMVERTLENCKKGIITIAELKRLLPKQINHNTLLTILDYLDRSNKICFGAKGMTWIHNTNPNLRKAIREGLEL